MRTLKRILAEYGPIALVLYLAIHTVVLLGFYAAIRMGWSPRGAAGEAGAWTVAYLLTKLTQPPRLAVTAVLTPVVSRLLRSRRVAPVGSDG